MRLPSLMSLTSMFQRKKPRHFVAKKQNREYIHLRTAPLNEYIIYNGVAAEIFAKKYSQDMKGDVDTVTRALDHYIDENGPITQSTVIILVGDMWAGKFWVLNNSNPNTLILELEPLE